MKFVKKISNKSKIITLCKGSKKELKKIYGVDSVVIPNCFNVDLRDDSVLEKKERSFAFIGRMDYESKNFKLLLESWNFVKNKKNWKLKIIGAGDKSLINNYIKRKNIGSVYLYDAISPSDVLQVLEKNSVFVLTSCHEGFPTVLIEAASRGNALITTRYDGYSDEIAKDGVNAFVVPFNASEVAEKIQGLIDDKSLLNGMQKNSISCVNEYIKLNDTIEDWKSIL